MGAHADVNELEYIASLHQTSDGDDDGWLDCSIEGEELRKCTLYSLTTKVPISRHED